MGVTYSSNVFTITVNASATGTGTMSCAAATVNVGGIAQSATACTGVGTAFLTELRPGSYIVVSGAGLTVHSIQSNTSLLAFKSDNTTGSLVVASPLSFTHSPPTTFADLKTAVDAQAATIAHCVGTSFNFTAASVTTQGGAVLFLDDYTSLNFGSAGAYRFNLSGGSHLVFRSGGYLAYHGNVQHSFFGGFISVYAGELTYQCKNPGANARQDFFAGGTSSNGISAMTLIYAGGTAGTAWAIYTHLENLVGKIASLKIVNAITATASGGSGPYIQFGNGTYRDVTFPSPVSTFGITQNFAVYLARSGGTTTLVNPILRGSTFIPASDAGSGVANLIDETWVDLPAGTVGTFTYTGGNTDINRIFSYYPGTLYQSSNPVSLRITNKNGVATTSGPVTAPDAVQLVWQTISKVGGVKTDLSPFALTARRKDMVEVTSTFTPTAPITHNNPIAVDSYYTTDASAQTGISAAPGTKTVTIDAGTTLTLDRRYDWIKWWLSQNLPVANFLAPSGTQLGYAQAWSDQVNGSSTAGNKFATTSTAGTVFVGGTGQVVHPIIDANGDSYVQETNGALLRVYSTEANRDARANALAIDVSRYRFTHASRPSDTLYLWVKVGAAEYPTQVTVAKGANVIDLGLTGLLLQMGAKVDNVPTKVWTNPTRTLNCALFE